MWIKHNPCYLELEGVWFRIFVMTISWGFSRTTTTTAAAATNTDTPTAADATANADADATITTYYLLVEY